MREDPEWTDLVYQTSE